MGNEKYEIGGYLDLSANWLQKEIPHNPVMLNTARNCIRYIARQRNIKRIFIPYYSCHTVVRALQNDGVEINFYSIDDNFMPIFPEDIQNGYFMYVNYYGLMNNNVSALAEKYENLIVDNSQAFFSVPIKGVDTVSSPRKFFGLPDGGLLYPGKPITEENFPVDKSVDRLSYLAKRLDYNASEAYPDSLQARNSFEKSPIKAMSKLTRYLLRSIDFEHARKQRRKNYKILDAGMKNDNKLDVELKSSVPLFYPFYCDKKDFRDYLISNNIFVGTYWPDVIDLVPSDSIEADLVQNIIPLPIDQRYQAKHIHYLLKTVKSFF